MNTPSIIQPIAIDATDAGSKRDLWGTYYVPDKCRNCSKTYIRYEKNIYSAQYYRCAECTGHKAFIRNILHSCTIQ